MFLKPNLALSITFLKLEVYPSTNVNGPTNTRSSCIIRGCFWISAKKERSKSNRDVSRHHWNDGCIPITSKAWHSNKNIYNIHIHIYIYTHLIPSLLTTSKPNFASPPSVIVQIYIVKHQKTRTKPFPLPTVFTNLLAFKPHLCTACARREACKKQTWRHRYIDATLYATELCWNLPWSHPMKHP